MRLSTERDDPGYQPCDITTKFRVLINGSENFYVVTADDETNYVKVFTSDPDTPAFGATREFFATKVEIIPKST